MKKQKPSKRLALNKTTIRALQARELQAAAGGCSYGYFYTFDRAKGCSGSCTNECSAETFGVCTQSEFC